MPENGLTIRNEPKTIGRYGRPKGKEETDVNNHRRLYAGLLCVALVLLLFVSSAYIVCEARHECAGETCAVCAQLLQAKALIQRFALAAFLLLTLFAALTLKRAFSALEGTPRAFRRTLVSWKVRLNN